MPNVVILKNWPVKGLRGRWLSVWDPEPHTPPPPCNLQTVYNVHAYSHREGGSTREKGRGATVQKAGSKIPTWLIVSTVYKIFLTTWPTGQSQCVWNQFYRDTFAGERGGGRVPIPTRGHTLWYSIYLCTLWFRALIWAAWWVSRTARGPRGGNTCFFALQIPP